MKTTWITVLIIVIVVVAGVWIWMSQSSMPTTSQVITPTSTASAGTNEGAGAPPSAPVVLDSATSATLGNYLVAANGMTLYKYTKDTPNVSNCSGQCSVQWPPYTVVSSSSLPASLTVTGKVGTITRADGSLQVTYNGSPVYFWYKDAQPGDTTGQNIGGVWFVVAP